MIVLLTPFETTTGLAAAIAAVNILIIIAIIFMERKNPRIHSCVGTGAYISAGGRTYPVYDFFTEYRPKTDIPAESR